MTADTPPDDQAERPPLTPALAAQFEQAERAFGPGEVYFDAMVWEWRWRPKPPS